MTTILHCNFCKTRLEHTFVDLGKVPLVSSYLRLEDLQKMEPFYPLHVYVCEKCYLVQLPEVQTPEQIFSNYPYFSSYSDSWLKHAKAYVEYMIDRFAFNKTSQVIEIASNDGYLLQYFKQKGVTILGVEPAKNVAETAQAKGIPTITKFFGVQVAKELIVAGHRGDLILGNNVLAHVPDLNDFVGGMKILLKPQGVITMEFPHLLRLMDENQFDTMYHEHFSYFSFHAVQNLFASHNLVIFDVEEIPTHGGSLRIYGKHKNDKTKKVTHRVGDLLEKEKSRGLLDLKTYYGFGKKVEATKRKLLQFLIQAKNEEKKIVGYGAPAKGNTLLNYCGIRTDFLDYTVDRSPHKQNKYLPGTHIPIKHPDKIKEDKPDYVLILPWNIKDEIMEQLSFIREWGGKFAVPIPEMEVFE